MKEKVMFDTCVWERFMLSQEKRINNSPLIPEELVICKEIFEIIKTKERNFDIFTSEFSILELRDQIWRLVCDKQLYEYGYSPSEFNKSRRDLMKLDKKLVELVEDKVLGLIISNQHSVKKIDFGFVHNHCINGLTSFDVILIDQARQHDCDYFVTTDNILIDYFNKTKIKCQIISAKTFLKMLKKA